MNKLLILIGLLLSANVSADLVHPMDFDGSAAQRTRVIEFIYARVRVDHCEGIVDMCQPTTIRMMESANLRAFKQLAKAEDRAIMNQVISTYCGTVDMCNYTTILMMYKQDLAASKAKLEW